jgi:hypothetical protein
MIDFGRIQEGMTVRDGTGRKLGTVASVGDTHFELEQDSPTRRDFMVRFHGIERVQGVDIYLSTPLPSKS